MEVNNRTIELIKRFEGLRLTAYRDAVGVWTIGYGHTTRAGKPAVRRGMRITPHEAEIILRRDVEKFARGVEKAIGVRAMKRLNANQFGALVSFAYNVGIGNFKRSSVLRAVKDGRLQDVPRLLMRWTKAGGRRLKGLVRRRRAEGRLFLTPHDKTKPSAKAVIRHKIDEVKERPGPAAAWGAAIAALIAAMAAIWQEVAKWLFG